MTEDSPKEIQNQADSETVVGLRGFFDLREAEVHQITVSGRGL